jgi:hypothetical protein
MPHISSNTRKPATTVTAILVLLLACLGLAACGSSSSASSTSANASVTTPAGAGGSTAPGGAGGTGAAGTGLSRFKALRECMQKNGITLPKRTPGQHRPGGTGGFFGGTGGGPQLPAGVTRAQYEAAIKKCGGSAFAGGGGARARFDSPVFKQAVAKFATCMRENGVNVPAPNTSGSGPVFDTKGIDTSSAQFRTAESKCSSDLRGAFPRRPGLSRATPPGGAPPSGETPAG